VGNRSSIFSEVSGAEVYQVSALLELGSVMLELFVSQLLLIVELVTLMKDSIEYKMLEIITYLLSCTKAAS
jgi:hypothetical protein